MFCPNCGTQLEDGALFCGSCGTKIEAAPVQEAPAQAAPTQAAPVQPTPVTPVQPTPVAPAAGFTPVQPKAPFKITGLMIATIVEAVAFLIVVVAFFMVGNNVYSYKKVAKTYFQAVSNGDWSAAYEQLDISESTFVSKDLFVKSQIKNAPKDVNKWNVRSAISSGISSSVDIQYTEKGESDALSMYIELNKQDKRKFLFFNSWKVSSKQYIAKDVSVSAPAGCTVYIDGIEIPKSMQTSNDDYGVTYEIPKMFQGTHEVQCVLGDFKGAKETKEIYGDYDYISLYDIKLSKDQQEEVLAVAYDDLLAWIDAGMKGEDFNSIKSMFTEDVVDDAEDYYEDDFAPKFKKGDGKEGLIKVELTDVKGDVSYVSVDEGHLRVSITIEYDYKDTFLDEDWWTNRIEEDTYSSGGYEYYYLEYIDGEWLLDSYDYPNVRNYY